MNSPLVNGAFYHVFNRGVEKRTVFEATNDYQRFLITLDFYRLLPTPRKLSTHLAFKQPPIPRDFEQKALVKILAFCLMPNHFHLLIQQLEDGGISEFIRRIIDSYTRYFNTKYERVGALFQGKFKAKVVENDKYMLGLSKYIHRNPLKLLQWENHPSEYAFSSYPGYLDVKRKLAFCDTEIISSYFNTSKKDSYRNFVEETDEVLAPEDLLIDDD